MAITITATNSLSIDQWAELMGVPVLEFNNLDISACGIEYDREVCSEFWTHWQYNATSSFSHEQLAFFIQQAEYQIERYLGYYVAPKWTLNEVHPLKIPYNAYVPNDRDISTYKFTARWKNVIDAGVPKTTVLANGVAVEYSDEDGDGYKELATIIYSDPSLADLPLEFPNKFRFFLPGHNGDARYELKHILHFDYDAVSNTVTICFNSWQLIDPDRYLPKGFSAKRAMSACDPTIYVDTIDISFEQVDTCKPQAELIWYSDPDTCRSERCIEQRQPACLTFLDYCEGIFTVHPVTVDEQGCIAKGVKARCQWKRFPDAVSINYISGCHDSAQFSDPPLIDTGPCPDLIKAILMLSVTNIGDKNCACTCIQSQIEYYNTDLAVGGQSGFRYPYAMLETPFGSAKRGAVEAYQLLESLKSSNKLCYQTW